MEFENGSCGNYRIDQMNFYFPRRHHHSEHKNNIRDGGSTALKDTEMGSGPSAIVGWDGMEWITPLDCHYH